MLLNDGRFDRKLRLKGKTLKTEAVIAKKMHLKSNALDTELFEQRDIDAAQALVKMANTVYLLPNNTHRESAIIGISDDKSNDVEIRKSTVQFARVNNALRECREVNCDGLALSLINEKAEYTKSTKMCEVVQPSKGAEVEDSSARKPRQDMVDDRPLMPRLKEKSLAQKPATASPTAEKQLKRKKRPAKDEAEASKRSKKKADHSPLPPTAEEGAKDAPKTPIIDLSKEEDGGTPTVNASQKPPVEHILTKNTGGGRQAVINLPKEGGMLCGPNSLLDAYPRFITRGDKAVLDGLPLESLKEKCGRSITDAAIYAFEAFAKYRKELSAALESEAKALTKEIDAGTALEDQKKINAALVTENGDLLAKLKKMEAERDAERVADHLKGKLEGVEEFKKSEGFLLEACKYIKEHLVAFENTEFGVAYSSEVSAMSYAYGMYTMQRDIYDQLKARDPLFKPAALGLPKRRLEPTSEHYATDYEDSSDEEVTVTETSAADEQAADLQADAETQVTAEQPHVGEIAQEGAQQTHKEAVQEETQEAAREDGAQQVDEDAQVFGQLADLV